MVLVALGPKPLATFLGFAFANSAYFASGEGSTLKRAKLS